MITPQNILRRAFILTSRFLLASLSPIRACQTIRTFTWLLPWKWGHQLVPHLSLLLNDRALPAVRLNTKHDFQMCLDLADTSIQRHVFFLGEWEPEETNIIKLILRKGDVLLDVGANVGYFSLLAAHLVGDHGKVYAFEAQPSLCAQLESNLTLNGLCNVEVLNVAVADRISDLVIEDVSALGNRGAAMLIPRGPKIPVITVKGTTVDDFCRSRGISKVNLVKMDIEGSEMLALRGMNLLLSSPDAPDLLCEINEPLLNRMGSSGDEVRSYLRSLGYDMYQPTSNGIQKVISHRLTVSEDLLGDNYLFSKRSALGAHA